MKRITGIIIAVIFICSGAYAQNILRWGDLGDGTYRNPVLNADYSDPDVIRVGDKFYMTASDFHFIGMQVLESDDLVNWKIISQVYDKFDFPGWDSNSNYAGGAWAPSIRYHDGKFWIFFCTIKDGLLMSTATDPKGPWSPLHCVENVEKWEDPCPFWDDDGQAYLGHSVHRAGPIIVHKMSPDGKRLLDKGETVYTGPVAEGTKWLKRNGYYYLIIPEGGVETGWQTVLRSRSIYGPYERQVVLEQGSTKINGPHQGALIDTPQGEWWFIHFQSVSPLGRVVHLQPAKWENDWLKIGEDYDGNGIGEPVGCYRIPNAHMESMSLKSPYLPQTSDDFNNKNTYWVGQKQTRLGLQWQWCHNPVPTAWSLDEREGWLTLHALKADSLKFCRNMLTQKVMGYHSEATTMMDCREITKGTCAGLLCIGKQFRGVGVCEEGIFTETNGERSIINGLRPETIYLRVTIDNDKNEYQFLYSVDGKEFLMAGEPFPMRNGSWKGTRIGLFCYNNISNGGKAMFDYFEYVILQ